MLNHIIPLKKIFEHVRQYINEISSIRDWTDGLANYYTSSLVEKEKTFKELLRDCDPLPYGSKLSTLTIAIVNKLKNGEAFLSDESMDGESIMNFFNVIVNCFDKSYNMYIDSLKSIADIQLSLYDECRFIEV
jgi:hypothetical protein